MMHNNNVLYVGPFKLPDKNAAAQRVYGNALALRDIGYEVYFLNYSEENVETKWREWEGFLCYECPKRNLLSSLTDIGDVQEIIKQKNISAVIAYNYPSVALCKLIGFCKKHGIRCYADATEWYVPQGKNFVFRIVKTIDTEVRMRLLHFRMDGVIAISQYLYDYYKPRVKTVKIPPLVDSQAAKWNNKKNIKTTEKTVFVYAGSPSAQKERLDLIVEAVEIAGKKNPLCLQVIGINKEQYDKTYGKEYQGTSVEFLGKLSHLDTLRKVQEANWTVVIRDNNKVVKAGFPTKIVESITCGVPVIANRFSNYLQYLDENDCIICENNELMESFVTACSVRLKPCKDKFDYNGYITCFYDLLNYYLKNC